MKKKLLCTILATTIFILGGCSSGNNNQQEAQLTQNDNPIENEHLEDDAIQEDTQKLSESQSNNISVDEQTVYEQDNIKITVKGFDFEGSFMGPELNFLIENNSEKNITVQARNVSVNGYMVDSNMSADVVTQKKSNDSLTFMSSSLEQCQIEQMAEIEFSFHILNSDDWSDFIDSDTVSITTSCATDYTQNYDDSGEIIFEDEGIRIISKGISEDISFIGPSLILYIENNTDNGITVQTRDTSVNGFMIDPTFSPEIASGKKIITTMTFLSSDMEDNQIDEIETIETSFHMFYSENWDTIQDTDAITISFH